MAITDNRPTPPRWQCEDCGRIFSGGEISPQLANIDDVHDVFSKHRGIRPNICLDCGGALRLRQTEKK